MQFVGELGKLVLTADWLLVTGAFLALVFGAQVGWRLLAADEADAAPRHKKLPVAPVPATSCSEGAVASAAARAAASTAPTPTPTLQRTHVVQPTFASLEEAVVLGGEVERCAPRASFGSAGLKMVLVLRRDLKPTEADAAVWGSTAAFEAVQLVRASAREPWLSWLRAWNRFGVAKIASRVDSADAMRQVVDAAQRRQLPVVAVVCDAAAPAAAASATPAATANSAKPGKAGKQSGDSHAAAAAAAASTAQRCFIVTGPELAAKAMQPQAFSVLCVAIGPAPVAMFDGVTDALKLY
jgi:peptidyl-tRNA hydrolase